MAGAVLCHVESAVTLGWFGRAAMTACGLLEHLAAAKFDMEHMAS